MNAYNQNPYMENYLLDGRCSLSNNAAENAIGPFTVGRKNWLFADSPKGPDASAAVYSIIETAKNYIKNNYHKDISLDDVSREVNISPYYFSKLFKETTGENFIEYLTNLRMDKAKELLQTTECSMKEICVKTGYSDPNYFSRSFKKNVGVTPTEYKENRGKGQEQGSV